MRELYELYNQKHSTINWCYKTYKLNKTGKVWFMLSNVGLDKIFWVEAVTYACHLINLLPSHALYSKIPMEVWSRNPIINYDSLHVFGFTTYYHVSESKLDPKVRRYHLWCLES